MAVKTTYICDRCGRESDNPSFNNGNRSGSMTITAKGQKGFKGRDGAWGGVGCDVKSTVCFVCADEFERLWEEFLKPFEEGVDSDG
jgi:hypothetical protein